MVRKELIESLLGTITLIIVIFFIIENMSLVSFVIGIFSVIALIIILYFVSKKIPETAGMIIIGFSYIIILNISIVPFLECLLINPFVNCLCFSLGMLYLPIMAYSFSE